MVWGFNIPLLSRFNPQIVKMVVNSTNPTLNVDQSIVSVEDIRIKMVSCAANSIEIG